MWWDLPELALVTENERRRLREENERQERERQEREREENEQRERKENEQRREQERLNWTKEEREKNTRREREEWERDEEENGWKIGGTKDDPWGEKAKKRRYEERDEWEWEDQKKWELAKWERERERLENNQKEIDKYYEWIHPEMTPEERKLDQQKTRKMFENMLKNTKK